ncbi:MAG: DUF2723 domain-containing protein [Candidatus Omnitrophica bacterium]|nr:DUF2723 domain-containing protein [Candidatus Omnitrophota bacterium]
MSRGKQKDKNEETSPATGIENPPTRRFDQAGPFVAFFLPLMVYGLTLAPTVTLEDSAEYISVARTLGLAHPPGAPTWSLIGHLATYFPLGNVALRTNALSALCGAGACLFLFLWLRNLGLTLAVSLAAGLTASFSRCIWGQAVVTEVYAMNLMMIFLCLFLVGRWRDTEDRRWLWGAALAGGIGAGVHHLLILLSPVIVVWALWGKWRILIGNPVTAIGAVAALAIGFSVYLYLPLRSGSEIAWERIDSFSSFYAYFSREMYKTAEGGVWTLGTLKDAFLFMGAFFKNLFWELGGPLIFLAIPGWIHLFKHRRDLGLILTGMLLMNVPVLLLLAGTSIFTPTSEYINQFYYLPATAAVAVLIVVGGRWTLDWGTQHMGAHLSGWARNSLVLAIPIIVLAANWKASDRSDYWIADEYGRNLVRNLEPGDSVFPLMNNESFLLMYFRHVAEDPRAFLLDDRFGWDPSQKPNRVYTAWDVGASSKNPIEGVFGDKETVPETLLYRVFNQSLGQGLAQCRLMRPIDLRVDQRPEEMDGLSPFERMIYASYSAYYARLGGAYFLAKKTDAAEKNWRLAEAFNPPDAYCHYLLGTLYEEAGHAGAEEHFKKALEVWPISYDPLDTRFYSVTLDEVREKAR